jgi:nicotinamide-nucleotide amidase
MIKKKLTLALAESITCGLASHQLNIVKGTSEVFKGSIVCYAEEVKINLLKVPGNLIQQYTAESQQVTDALAKNLNKLIEADIYGAITGLAVDGASETKSKPVGTVFISLLWNEKLIRKRQVFKGSPLQIKKQACEFLYKLITAELKK